MSTRSRIRKAKSISMVSKPDFNSGTSGSSVRLSPDIFFKRGRNEPREVVAFWAWFESSMRKLRHQYRDISATRRDAGEFAGQWLFHGSEPAIRAFKDLAREAAFKIGYHGGPEGAVNFWCDHMNGDHVIRVKHQPTPLKDIDLFTQNSDGTREFHMGRYKQSGVDHYFGDKPQVPAMPVPAPITTEVPLYDSGVPVLKTASRKPEPMIKVVSS